MIDEHDAERVFRDVIIKMEGESLLDEIVAILKEETGMSILELMRESIDELGMPMYGILNRIPWTKILMSANDIDTLGNAIDVELEKEANPKITIYKKRRKSI